MISNDDFDLLPELSSDLINAISDSESKEHDMEDNLTGSIKEICSILNRIYFVC